MRQLGLGTQAERGARAEERRGYVETQHFTRGIGLSCLKGAGYGEGGEGILKAGH